jgi:hypothetical protein
VQAGAQQAVTGVSCDVVFNMDCFDKSITTSVFMFTKRCSDCMLMRWLQFASGSSGGCQGVFDNHWHCTVFIIPSPLQ